MKNQLLFIVLASLVILTSCEGDQSVPPPGPQLPNVSIEYRAATEIDDIVRARFPNCVLGVGQTHIHPSWRSYTAFNMTANPPDRWLITFQNVPTGQELRIRINDPNACATDPNGATIVNIFANGVRLTRRVDTPGNGTEPGLAFSVATNGTVTP